MLALAALAWLGLAAPASASSTQSTIFEASNQLLGGGSSSAKRRVILNQLQSLGVNTVDLLLPWRFFAPNPNRPIPPRGFDPANPASYPQGDWAGLDDVVRGAAERGINVLLTVTEPIPNWASASRRSELVQPDPSMFGQFVEAVGSRYGGSFTPPCGCANPPPPLPRVSFWSIWNEPNSEIFLRPQYVHGKPYSPTLYRRLFLAGQRGLQTSGHGSDPLLIGETAPGPGRGGVDPINFLRGVLCLNSRYQLQPGCSAISAAGWAHHPYDPHDPPFANSRKLLMVGSIGRLTQALARAASANATTSQLPVYVTEYGVQSKPRSASLQQQAEYLGIAEYLLWRDPQILSFAQYLLNDDPSNIKFSFPTGLRFHNGRAKPSLAAFPITLVVQRTSPSTASIWGHVRPTGGPYQVAVKIRGSDGRVSTLRTIETDSLGYFMFSSDYRPGQQWRAEARLPDGRFLRGPFVRAYRFG